MPLPTAAANLLLLLCCARDRNACTKSLYTLWRQVQREWSVRSGNVTRTFHVMVTPRVQEEVRKHFGCDSLEGAELEDQGGDGTALTHWEKRLFQNEAMTGTVHTQNPAYSRLTFALLEDSGWYFPNYDMVRRVHRSYLHVHFRAMYPHVNDYRQKRSTGARVSAATSP